MKPGAPLGKAVSWSNILTDRIKTSALLGKSVGLADMSLFTVVAPVYMGSGDPARNSKLLQWQLGFED